MIGAFHFSAGAEAEARQLEKEFVSVWVIRAKFITSDCRRYFFDTEYCAPPPIPVEK